MTQAEQLRMPCGVCNRTIWMTRSWQECEVPHVVLVLTLHYIVYAVYSSTWLVESQPWKKRGVGLECRVAPRLESSLRFYGKSNAANEKSKYMITTVESKSCHNKTIWYLVGNRVTHVPSFSFESSSFYSGQVFIVRLFEFTFITQPLTRGYLELAFIT